MTPSNMKSGFRMTGIYPFDRHVFTSDDFLSSSVTDREILNITPTPSNSIKQNASTSSSSGVTLDEASKTSLVENSTVFLHKYL
ncbi:hypothetical protein RN001_004090 [Aquatica leii]|uniref:Uncharacterized protein n=1 Tax=Aquatica leii TaxID=1421715 RepID=A0AAN7SMM5_9COLE|nr:hypothetical protein RN001_004090 [Aquatica leii]